MHVYVAVWKAAVGQMLSCQREGGNMQDLYAVAIVENNDTPIDNSTHVSNGKFRGRNFRELLQNIKIRESFLFFSRSNFSQ